MPHNLCYEFGPYRFDVSKRVLTRGSEAIYLAPKATDILIILVMNAGELVEKDELLKSVWPDTFVEESNLTQNIFTLRRAFGDERADPRYIETVTRRGYRFIAPVKVLGADQTEATEPSERRVVAVLPFLNTTGDPELEYLAEGLTDNIINNLSRVSQLRVMSRSGVLRYKTKGIDPQRAGKELGVNAVLVGRISSRAAAVAIAVELVDSGTGWQLWGESFDFQTKDILEIQDTITRNLLAALKLRLTGDEETRVTARYTENAQAYEAYLEGRYHWSRYTRKGIEKAIKHFRHAIELDPNYALAYAGIVDCYLRLATNYLPPDDDGSSLTVFPVKQRGSDVSDPKLKLRFEWDWKGAEREMHRATDLKSDYPSAHQWYAAYRVSKGLYEESGVQSRPKLNIRRGVLRDTPPPPIAGFELTANEQLQVCCAIVREQIDAGNYEAGRRILQPWWSMGRWPKLDALNQQSCADLLFTAGELAGFVASTVQFARGQKHAEELLNGSVALFEQLGLKQRAAEARIELALCYHRQGLLDIARSTLLGVLNDIRGENPDLLSLALMRLGSLERQAGRLKDALERLMQVASAAEVCGPWMTARCQLELASTYKDLAISENVGIYFADAQRCYLQALFEFKAVGQHRYVGIVENNIGLLLLSLGSYQESEEYLLHARTLFNAFSDTLRGAQVNETLARLYIDTKRYALADEVINQALTTFELADGEALLAEALTTSGVAAARLGRFNDARRRFEAAHRIAARCGDQEGAGLALLTMFDEIGECLEKIERIYMGHELQRLLGTTQQTALRRRLEEFIANMPLSLSSPPDSSPPEK